MRHLQVAAFTFRATVVMLFHAISALVLLMSQLDKHNQYFMPANTALWGGAELMISLASDAGSSCTTICPQPRWPSLQQITRTDEFPPVKLNQKASVFNLKGSRLVGDLQEKFTHVLNICVFWHTLLSAWARVFTFNTCSTCESSGHVNVGGVHSLRLYIGSAISVCKYIYIYIFNI